MNLYQHIFINICDNLKICVIVADINANACILICIDDGFLDAIESHLQNGTCTCHAFRHHESEARERIV